MNAFLSLQEQDLAAFEGERQAVVRRGVEKNLESAEFVASIIELFGPIMANTLTSMAGGDIPQDNEKDESYLTLREVADDDEEPYGPGYPNAH